MNTPTMDWGQVVLNGGPPCFHVEGNEFCGRAERWDGHGHDAPPFHHYVSLATALANARAEAWRDAIKITRSNFHNAEVNHSRWNAAITHLVAALECSTEGETNQ